MKPGTHDHAERAVISAEDVRRVVANYALVRPISMRPLGLGSRSNAKSRLTTPRGDFLLKRRAPQRSGFELVEFIHAFHRHLEARAVQVAPLMRDKLGRTAVEVDGGVYELFGWVHGGRWSRTVAEAKDAGLAFGRLLRAAATCKPQGTPRTTSFHAHPVMAQALSSVPKIAAQANPEIDVAGLKEICVRLGKRAARAAQAAQGIQELAQGVVHGDLHPGNVLFEKGRLQAILDFDGARMDWRACEIANAALHFGNDPVAGTSIEDWDPAMDVKRVTSLIAGAEHGMAEPLTDVERKAIPWLMIEACTLESVVPIVRTGRFAHLRADRLLSFVDRKAAWIEDNIPALS